MAARRSSKKREAQAKAAKTKSAGAKERREFVAEAEEILEKMLEDLSELHEQRHADTRVDPDLVNRIFRSAHSLKGLAGMFSLEAIGDLSHHLEDILDGLRLGRIGFDSPALDLLDDGVALLATLMTGLEGADGAPDGSAAVRDFIDRIDAAIRIPECEGTDPLAGLEIDESLLRALTEYEEHRLRENLQQGRRISLVDSTFEISAFEEGLAVLTSIVREVGEVISTLPSSGDVPESRIRFSLLVATDIDTEALRTRIDDPEVQVQSIDSVDAAEASSPADGGGSQGEALDSLSTAKSGEIESLRSISETVRVDIRKLDELMNLVGELVIQRNAIAAVASRLIADVQTARIGAELMKAHKNLDRKLKDLQSGVLDVRMVPLRQIFEKLSRVARRLRRDLGKEVVLDFKGADTELDKLIVEQLVDPLVHIIRNAFDHALETPAERRAAGKAAAGRISVRGLQRGNHVVIEVEDDGRGMNVEAIRAKALAAGMISENESLGAKDILNLVFQAGFSTCEVVSDTSGRGVGMDVVRTNLAEMGGMVDLSSREGRGTTVTITLPITLAIIQALIVGVGEERFAIPLNSVLETLVVEPEEIGQSQGREILNLRGTPLLLRRLGEEFEIQTGGRDVRQFAVVLGMGEQRLGLLVDRLEGQQDTVIKSIKGPVQQIRGIAGATELGDRGAILVIDVSALVGDAIRRREAA